MATLRPMPASDARPTDRFSNRVENYVRYRPTYPTAVLDILKQEIGLSPTWRIADIGSGTGISSELFLRNGNVVYGVEPNRPMREAAERLLDRYPKFTSFDGAAEATTLPSRSVDCIVAAQAFHWFDAPTAREECVRVLRPGGWSVLIWNTRRVDTTPFLRGYEALLLEYGTDYQRVRHDRIDKARLSDFFGASGGIDRFVDNRQRLTLDGLRGRLLSSSYVPAPGEPRHEAMIEALERLFRDQQHDGEVSLDYNTQVFMGQFMCDSTYRARLAAMR